MRKVSCNKSFDHRPQSAPMKERTAPSKVGKQNQTVVKTTKPQCLNFSFSDKKVPTGCIQNKKNPLAAFPASSKKKLNTTLLSKKQTTLLLNDSMRCNTPLQKSSIATMKGSQRNSTVQFPNTTKNTQFPQEALELEVELTEKLKKMSITESNEVISSQKLSVYRNIFQKIIDRDKNFGSLLCKI